MRPETRLIVDDYVAQVRRAKTKPVPRLLVILRGMPCSGKTEFAKELGTYAMVRSLFAIVSSSNARGDCLQVCADALAGRTQRRVDIVVVDEHNLHSWEYAMYIGLHQPPNCLATVVFRCPRTLLHALDMCNRRPGVVVSAQKVAMWYAQWRGQDNVDARYGGFVLSTVDSE